MYEVGRSTAMLRQTETQVQVISTTQYLRGIWSLSMNEKPLPTTTRAKHRNAVTTKLNEK